MRRSVSVRFLRRVIAYVRIATATLTNHELSFDLLEVTIPISSVCCEYGLEDDPGAQVR